MVFKWSLVSPRPFLDNCLTILLALVGGPFGEASKPFCVIFRASPWEGPGTAFLEFVGVRPCRGHSRLDLTACFRIFC